MVRDGEFTTACAQTCPTGALTFGNLLDPQSRVAQMIADPSLPGVASSEYQAGGDLPEKNETLSSSFTLANIRAMTEFNYEANLMRKYSPVNDDTAPPMNRRYYFFWP
jgi:Fe-S-cluster-containing dehydrogenase component